MSDADATLAAALPGLSMLLPWHAPQLRSILAARASLPHAMLIVGGAGIGKRNLAMNLAQALLCESPRSDGSACGTCASCGYFAAGQHPDFRLLERATTDDEGNVKLREQIPVDDVRELRDLVELSTHRLGNKVALIDPAEAMNHAAANALLKTLEEPPPGTFLLLVSHQPGRLPATIVSRCRRVVVPPPSREAAIAWLAQQGIAAPAGVLAQANGAPLAALALADRDTQAERGHWLAALARPRALSASALSARIDAVPKDARKAHLAAIVDWLIAWTTDLARVAANAPPGANADHAAALASLAPQVARIALSRYHRALLGQRARLAHPLAPRLTLEALLIEYKALFDHGSR